MTTTSLRTRPLTIDLPAGFRDAAALDAVRAGQATLSRGDGGASVQTLQAALIAQGFLPARDAKGGRNDDGAFGGGTDQAVRAFQRAHGLSEDGVVGKNTLDALLASHGKGKGKPATNTSDGYDKLPTLHTPGPREVAAPDYKTAGGTRIRAVPNSYAPRTTPQTIVPKDERFHDFLKGQTNGMEKVTDVAKAQTEITAWAARNPTTLANLGIKDLRNLDPKQAAALSQCIATDITTWAPDGKLSETRPLDSMGLDTALVALRTKGPQVGACRNFAEATHSSFEILKAMQNPATTQLANTYAVDNPGGGHRTTAFVTIEPGGHAVATIVDAAWNEGDVTHGRKGTDYTFSAAANDPKTSIRYSYFLRNVANHVGDGARDSFKSTFDNGAAYVDNHWAGDKKIALAEVDKAGGIANLNAAINRLEPWNRGTMLAMLEPDVMVALNAHRGAVHETAVSPTAGANNLMYGGRQIANVAANDAKWNQARLRVR